MQDIYKVLNDLNIVYEEYKHPPFYTCDDADAFYSDAMGGKSKNLFLRNRNGDKNFLVIMESSKKLDVKKLSDLLQESKLSFASPERLKQYLDLTPGAVSIFGLINDVKKEVVAVIDNDLLKHEKLHYHPNVNTATLVVSKSDFLKFLDWTGNKILFFDL